MSKGIYITTPIYYVNDVPHIGHAYTTIACDVLARFYRMSGQHVYYLTGTDEHGQKIADSAAKRGISSHELVNEVRQRFIDTWEKLEIEYDGFISTTEERHKKVVQEFFKRLQDADAIYKGEYEGWYCTACETFWTELQLVDGNCPNEECHRPVEKVKQESYFLKLSAFQDQILSHIESHPDFIQPQSRRNEIVSFIKEGLKDLSISRVDVEWGVKVPGDEQHSIYVWFDALINYVSALGFTSGDETLFRELWPADVHVMGKEIVRFHAVIWPIMLMAIGVELPKVVFGHGWWTVEGAKMSKTAGNVIDPVALAQEYGVDVVRYILLRDVPFGSDGDFSKKNLEYRYNAELANNLGNLLSRTLTMIEKYCNGDVPSVDTASVNNVVVSKMNDVYEKYHSNMVSLKFDAACANLLDVLDAANKFIEEQQPWNLEKEGKTKELHEVLYTLLETLRVCGTLFMPFMPGKIQELRRQLGLTEEKIFSKDYFSFGNYPPDVKVVKGDPLFLRLKVS
ncbi:methionine--tRNA ligase [Candidatus Margulisiibacteriota bacterium]